MTTGTYSQAQRRRLRRKRIRQLGYRNYNEYLTSPSWGKVKARYRASGLPQVCMCGEEKVQLHHKTYERVGEELLTDLVPLCGRCHAALHTLERRGDMTLDPSGLQSEERAAQYAEERAPGLARARADLADPSLSEQLRRIEPYLRPSQKAEMRRRIEKLKRELSEKDQAA